MAKLSNILGYANSSTDTIKDVVTRKHRRTDTSMDDSTPITSTLEDTFTRKRLRIKSRMSTDDSVPIITSIENSTTIITTTVEKLLTRNRHRTGSEDSINGPTAISAMNIDFTIKKRIRIGSEESTATSIEEIEKGMEEDMEGDESATMAKFGGLKLEDEAEDEVMSDTSSAFVENLFGGSWVKGGYWSDASLAMELDDEDEPMKEIKENEAIENTLQLIIDESQCSLKINNNSSTQGYWNGQAPQKHSRITTQHHGAPSPQARNNKNNKNNKNHNNQQSRIKNPGMKKFVKNTTKPQNNIIERLVQKLGTRVVQFNVAQDKETRNPAIILYLTDREIQRAMKT